MVKTGGWKTKPGQLGCIFVGRRRDGRKVLERDRICAQIPAEVNVQTRSGEHPGSAGARGFPDEVPEPRLTPGMERVGSMRGQGRSGQLGAAAASPVLPHQPGCVLLQFYGMPFYKQPDIKPRGFFGQMCVLGFTS